MSVSHKKEMWLDIAKKMELPWAEVELCHWRLGREWMERRASDRDFLTREERLRYTPSDGLPPPPVDGDEAQALAQLQQEGISDEVWSGKEERILWECKAAGLDWTDISRRLPGRNAESCQAYYDLLVTQGGGWSPELQTELSRLYCRNVDEDWNTIVSVTVLSRNNALDARIGEHHGNSKRPRDCLVRASEDNLSPSRVQSNATTATVSSSECYSNKFPLPEAGAQGPGSWHKNNNLEISGSANFQAFSDPGPLQHLSKLGRY
ncbi:hypothetical protein E4U39_004233 [Claviceps sp. Clav50 group G5]|nr:hypothetical protein E4U39_004233 [Claviceps sp. Clav50 group G5]